MTLLNWSAYETLTHGTGRACSCVGRSRFPEWGTPRRCSSPLPARSSPFPPVSLGSAETAHVFYYHIWTSAASISSFDKGHMQQSIFMGASVAQSLMDYIVCKNPPMYRIHTRTALIDLYRCTSRRETLKIRQLFAIETCEQTASWNSAGARRGEGGIGSEGRGASCGRWRVMVRHLLSSLLVQQLDASGQRVDGLLEAAGADNVLQILQHALVVLRLTPGLHHGDLLHLALDTGHKVAWTHTRHQAESNRGIGGEGGALKQ